MFLFHTAETRVKPSATVRNSDRNGLTERSILDREINVKLKIVKVNVKK